MTPLPVLPPPFSSPYPWELSRRARTDYRKLLRSRDRHCFYCRRPVSKHGATLDHVIPKSKGGLSTFDNLVLCCGACNYSKSARSFSAWLTIVSDLYWRLTTLATAEESGSALYRRILGGEDEQCWS